MAGGQTRASTRAQLVQYAKTRITVVAGPDMGQEVEAAGALVRVGSAPDNDLVLNDDTVSRRHCEIEISRDGIRVRDVGSTNGVLLGGLRVHDVSIDTSFAGATTLCLGDSQLGIVCLKETVDRYQSTTDRFGDVIGASPRMRELFADLDRIASTDMSLLIEGETGTGKDAIAEAVHRASERAEGPFIVFDCGAVAPSLAESELFGHERGAFTGAVAQRAGVFEDASGGTLFLDEIGELPRDLQPKLLRVLEKRELRRVGSTKTLAVDVRIIAATNRNLAAEVARGTFREDLYFRLAGAHVVAPPLRERIDDLPLLVEHFLSLERPPRSIHEVPPEVWQMLATHRWPGNVRELRNAVQRLLVTPERPIASGPRAACRESAKPDEERPAPAVLPLLPLRIARREASESFEREYVQAVLSKTGGNVSRAASLAEVSRQMMQKLMRKHGITSGSSSAPDAEAPDGSAKLA
jgi:transcriptional regulator with GAF, ATPase, and Fis domain